MNAHKVNIYQMFSLMSRTPESLAHKIFKHLQLFAQLKIEAN